ncbi:hypothetical protein [Epiphyas postvittana nucleopolyhedrovirus]|uniref:Uncharacterized protein n=1 Tax=Epiphyas postvittana nucleopolyhedrovirus TaxID=70600 RepID=Q91GI9_NPVEP|nr:hypothetical protein [Epiphyas postvittana nucleopolyhedrovirus]AAK85628.1 unknown [Epiphyas postvittana nucleopolyhedrovirus]
MPNNLLTKFKFVKRVSKIVSTLLCKCVARFDSKDGDGGDCYMQINNNCNFIYINVVVN